MFDADPPAGAMQDLRIVFLNGPPRSGKDTAGKAIRSSLDVADTAKLSGPLKRMTHAAFNLPSNLPIDAFEDVKDEPRPEFFGMTPREAYIMVSEQMVKPKLGQDFFGKLLIRSAWRRYLLGTRLIAVTDSGFGPEAQPIIDIVGPSRCLLMRLHAENRGKTFKGDSRSYIDLPGVRAIDVHNQEEGPVGRAAFEKDVVSLARTFTWLED